MKETPLTIDQANHLTKAMENLMQKLVEPLNIQSAEGLVWIMISWLVYFHFTGAGITIPTAIEFNRRIKLMVDTFELNIPESHGTLQ